MLGSRNREQFSIQALLLCDAFLVFQGFYIGDKLRPFLRPLLGLSDDGQIGLAQISWLLFIVVPFTPLVLEVFGFYRNMMRKTLFQSLTQMIQALLVISVAIAAMVLLFQDGTHESFGAGRSHGVIRHIPSAQGCLCEV